MLHVNVEHVSQAIEHVLWLKEQTHESFNMFFGLQDNVLWTVEHALVLY